MPRPWLRSAFNEVNRYFHILWILLNCQHCSTKLKNRNSYYGYIITLHVFAQNNINILKIMKFTAFETSPNIIYFFCTHICNICNLTKKHLKVHQKYYPILRDLPHEMLKILFCNLQQILQCLINNIYARLWRDKSNKYLPIVLTI